MIILLSKYGALALFHSFNNCFSWAFGVCLGCTHIAWPMLNTNNFHLLPPFKKAYPSLTGVILQS